ncbi:MAG TPA: choice-of-anchor D domain-containing protein [Pseudomonadota bacterium]|nr:choice-of-anchor D domain-containing protein [Pseudomonadota bacterium]
MHDRSRLGWVGAVSAAILALGTGVVRASPPALSFAPPPNQPGTEITMADTAFLIEVSATPPGVLDPIGQNNTTQLTQCGVVGDDNITVDKGGMTFYAGVQGAPEDMPSQTFLITCEPLEGVSTSALFRCGEKQGFSSIEVDKYQWDVVCPGSGAAVPEIDPAPPSGSTLNFNANQPNDASAQFTINNIGTGNLGPLSISGVSAPFSVNPNPGANLAPGSRIYTVTCAGATEGNFLGALNFNSNDADEPTVSYNLNCTIAGAEVDATPVQGTPINLVTTQGVPATPGVIQIANPGTATLTIGAPSGLSGSLSAVLGSGSVAAGNVTSLTVNCNGSAAAGPQNLSVTTNDPDGGEGTLSWPVTCDIASANAPEFDPSIPPPGPINLATTTGVAAAPVVITIQNNGNATLNLSGLSIISLPLTVTPSSTTVGIGSSATLTIGCSSASAANSNQQLTFSTNDPDDGEAFVVYNLGCTVTAAAAPEFGSIPAAPGPITVNTSTGANGSANLLLQNVGQANLTLSVNTQPGAPFANVTVPASLAATSSQLTTVNCNSASAGTFNRTLILNTNDTSEGTVSYNLVCNVVAPTPEFNGVPAAPGPLSIVTDQNVQGSASLTVQNLGNASLSLNPIVVAPAPTFSISPIAPQTVTAAGSRLFSVRCLNATAGNYAGTVTFTSNDPNEGSVLYNVNCRVNVVAPEYDSSPRAGTTFAFYTDVGVPYVNTVRVRNLGNATLNYSLAGLSGIFSSNPAIGGPYTILPGAFRDIAVTCSGLTLTTVTQTLGITHNDTGESPANYRFTCSPDIRLNAAPVLRALIGSPLVSEPGDLLFWDSFE